MNNIHLFPIYDKEVSPVQLTSTYEFSYDNEEGKSFPLQINEETNNLGFIVDEEEAWNIGKYGININRHIHLENLNVLFGDSDFAIACKNSKIGVAFLWASKDSCQRGVLPLGSFSEITDEFNENLNFVINKGQLRGVVELSIVLYLKKHPSIIYDNENRFADKEGIILGYLDTYYIKLDGQGSFFPTMVIEDKGGPLWSVVCDWKDDIKNDLLEESVMVLLNKSNPNYIFIDRKNKAFNRQLAIEVFASAFSNILEEVRTKNGFADLDDGEPGSIASALVYIRDTLNWDFSTPITLSKSIRSYFDKNLKKK